jgi:hypothetical protein
MWIEALLVFGMAAPPPNQDQAAAAAEASAAVTQALNLYAKAGEASRGRLSELQNLATQLFFSAAMGVEDNALSLSGLCQMQRASSAPALTKERVLGPLIQQYRTSSAQDTANLSLALPSLPQALTRHAHLVLMAVTNAAAVIDRGCGP